MTDMVNHPAHYETHPVIKGECWDYAKHLCNGAEFSAFRYAWRYADKFNPLEDLNKAGWYIDRLIEGDVTSTFGGLLPNVKAARRDVAGVLENDLAAYTGGTSGVSATAPGEFARRGSVNVLIALLRGEYALAKAWLDHTTACYAAHVAGNAPATETDLVDALEEVVETDGAPVHKLTGFTYSAVGGATMSYVLDTDKYLVVEVAATTSAGTLDSYTDLMYSLAGCEDLVAALLEDNASLFRYNYTRGQSTWSLKVEEDATSTRNQVANLKTITEVYGVTDLTIEVFGLG